MALQNGQRIAAQLRRYRMLNMKIAGASERQIAEQEGISHGLVNKDIKKVLEDLARENTGSADKIRALQMERYNALLLRMWDSAMQSDEGAVDRVIKIMDRINAINGVIPDKPLINMAIEQTSIQMTQAPFTFRIENAGDNADQDIPETESLPQTIGGDIFQG